MGGIVFIAEELLTKVPRIWESLNVWITIVPKSTWSGFWFSVVIIYPEWRIARRIGMSTQMVKTQNLLGFQMLPSTESLEFRILVVLGYPFQWASVSNHLLCPHFHFYIHILSYDDIWYNICIHIQYIIYIYTCTYKLSIYYGLQYLSPLCSWTTWTLVLPGPHLGASWQEPILCPRWWEDWKHRRQKWLGMGWIAERWSRIIMLDLVDHMWSFTI